MCIRDRGNLDLALRKGPTEFDLFMRTDTNTRGHHQWFYFSVTNKVQGTFKFNILNFTKHDSLYRHGMRVAIFSAKKSSLAREGTLPKHYLGWHRGCENIQYEVSRLTVDSGVRRWLPVVCGGGGKKVYYCLSFEYSFDYADDEVFFAYSVPYTYTDMNKLLREIKNIRNVGEFMREGVLCKSLGGISIPILTITAVSYTHLTLPTICSV
eukprot:TRINITY_DN17284_c0_g1_i3.p1 TRINITY_DN17284_c0_g1~~TRINITY_DN17284_c0_g1_i3.p1  ORF type:complete len:210 (+),score=36.90 TRINITY_DN17284_c0_g1_i3:69-698(+)